MQHVTVQVLFYKDLFNRENSSCTYHQCNKSSSTATCHLSKYTILENFPQLKVPPHSPLSFCTVHHIPSLLHKFKLWIAGHFQYFSEFFSFFQRFQYFSVFSAFRFFFFFYVSVLHRLKLRIA